MGKAPSSVLCPGSTQEGVEDRRGKMSVSRRTRQRRVLTYSTVYNRTFRKGRDFVNPWIRSQLSRSIRRPLSAHSIALRSHIATLMHTQHIRTWFDHETRHTLARTTRMAHIATMISLRRLQRRILQHLWRPGGRLMMLNGSHIVTSMPCEE